MWGDAEIGTHTGERGVGWTLLADGAVRPFRAEYTPALDDQDYADHLRRCRVESYPAATVGQALVPEVLNEH